MEDRTHTPGLMQVAIRYDGLYNIRDESCELVAEGLTESNAKEIVRRFNAFSDLLSALKKIVNNWTDLHPKDRQQARLAILKAKGIQ